MDNLDNNPASQPDNDQLIEQIQSLRHLVVSLLLLVIVVSGTLNIYLLRQYRTAHNELMAIRAQGQAMATERTKTTDFLNKLTEFGRTHPDFAPILAKYGIKPTNAPVAMPAKK